ncbi:hypothetical protein D3C73_940860 [compost metagenome]
MGAFSPNGEALAPVMGSSILFTALQSTRPVMYIQQRVKTIEYKNSLRTVPILRNGEAWAQVMGSLNIPFQSKRTVAAMFM